MTDIVARLDKACGKSFIAEGQICSKEVVGRSTKGENSSPTALAVNDKTLSARKLLTAGGLIASTALLGVLTKSGHEILTSKLPDDAVPPPEPPKGLYDSFQSGDLIYQAVDFAGTKRAHYSVYVGKVNGEHRIFDVSTKKSSSGKTEGSVAAARPIDEAHSTGSSFQPASRVSEDGERPSAEQLNKIIDQLNGKDFDWSGFKTNCETFARTITNDLPVSTQSKNVSPLTAEIVSGLMRAALPKGYEKRAIKQNEVAKIVKKTLNQDAAMNPKAQAAQILTPIFNNRPVTVMSVSLSPEGNPVGVFRGEPRPGQTHYYTFNMGQKVTFKRVMVKRDAMDEGCGCTECDKKKKRKGEAFEKVDADPCWEGFKQVGMKRKGKKQVPNCVPVGDKVDARLDKKCGASGIPDNAKCTKAEGGATPDTMSEAEAQAHVKNKIETHYKKQEAKKARSKAVRKQLLILGGLIATNAAIRIASNIAVEKQVMQQHGVDKETARKFRKDVAKAYQKYGSAGANAFYEAWKRENDPKSAGSSTAKASVTDRNWNKTLDVPADATPAQVKAAFRKKAKETHPDYGGSAAEFAKVQKAWESAQALGKVKRGDSIEMEWFIKRMDARSKVTG
jgi:hypothetical protein